MIWNRRRAAPLGVFVPASQASTVLMDTPRTTANADWASLSSLRSAFTRHLFGGRLREPPAAPGVHHARHDRDQGASARPRQWGGRFSMKQSPLRYMLKARSITALVHPVSRHHAVHEWSAFDPWLSHFS
jgi:hypothetical protein